MPEDFRGLAAFAAVAEAGSFSAAARRLKLSTSVVSHHVSKLEAKVGASLFFRSTRSLSLTAEGQKVLPAAQRMVASAQEALDLLTDEADQPVGSLRITMPSFGIDTPIHQAVWAFAKQYPMVTLSLSSTDRSIDLVRDGFDLAIRLGVLTDSSLKGRRIGTFHRAMVATPEYLAARGPLTDLDDLKACDFISLAMIPTLVTLQKDGEHISFEPDQVRLEVDSVAAAKAAVLAGLGVQRLPLSEVQDELDSGELVLALPDWHPPELGIYAVWPDSGAQKNLTRRLVDFLVAAQKSAA
ncbi:MAG: LysR family transcriptional regulator [Pseudomonadota bacterium]